MEHLAEWAEPDSDGGEPIFEPEDSGEGAHEEEDGEEREGDGCRAGGMEGYSPLSKR
jgi:hypothetical protein